MRSKKGFTLIELLVVIAIIAVLLAIMVPALGLAKAIAKKVVCTTNIRQNGQAFYLYSTENDDELFKGPGIDHISHYSWGGVTLEWEYDGYLNAAGYDMNTRPYDRPLNAYLPVDSRAYVCPNDPSGDTKLWEPFGVSNGAVSAITDNTQAYYSSTGTSFQYNAYLIFQNRGNYKRTTQVKAPSQMLLVYEWPAYDVRISFFRPAWWTDLPRWSFHDDAGHGLEPDLAELDRYDEYGNNAVFVDGHVEYVSFVPSVVNRGLGYRWW